MRRSLLTLVLLHFSALSFAGDEETLSALLDEFLQGASINDVEIHDRFWSDDLIYTSSNGTRFGKETLMEGLGSAGEPDTSQEDELPRYWAEDRQIALYGDMAVVAFRLLAESHDEGSSGMSRTEYFNTGTFQNQEGRWRAVAWQATRIPSETE